MIGNLYIHVLVASILWNHFYLWGPMFVDYQNFASFSGHTHVIPWIIDLLHYNLRRFITLLYTRVAAEL